MNGALALAALRDAPHAVLMSDADGTVRLCNRAAGALLDIAPALAEGQPCWKVSGFETLDGKPFCSCDCAIQRQARAGRLEPLHRVLVRTRGTMPMDVDLLTFLIAPTRRGRRGVLHVLLPARPACGAGLEGNGQGTMESATPFFSRLTPRETEVLRLLTRGFETSAIALSLRVSPVTVRTHVQRVLRKLGVHRRLDAVLAVLARER